ncbi:MAG: hypothetical protein KZQ89_14420 [Candidatus Thiodiazotropha sp. (ex Lucinoma kastoroae)]|nr:hypothetical protein [Candidatus Thiodiazotropha sp. (ex Lucinoma kastoroae)]
MHHTHDQDDLQWITSLKAKAREIRKHIRQLIRGDVGNSAPIANAGPDQSVQSGQAVTLDGSASSDPDGDMLQYSWVILSQPSASDIVIGDPQATTPSFTPYASGPYIFELTVSDDESISQPDTVIITVSPTNTRPIANAGQDQTGTTGDTITLDGSASSDADGDSMSFDWLLFTIPNGSTSNLNDSTAVRPTFSPDLAGLYQALLIVNDGQLNSLEDVIDIQIDNLNIRPVAIAGPDQSVYINQLAQLDGSASHDADGDGLNWLWSLISTPSASSAQLSDELAINPSFTADIVGQYIVQLVVDDSQDSSDPDSVIINAFTPNTIPVANAGADQSDYVGNLVTLDGSASSDADGDNLTFNWSLTAIPDGSSAQLDDPNMVNPTFVIDVPGDYVAQLIVNDGKANSAPDEILISTLNSRPVANAGDDQTIMIGQTAQLDGAASADADNDTLSYSWSISSSPEGSTATLSDATSTTPTFTADQIGFYLFQLIANDGILDSTPATFTLQVSPLEALTITLDEPSDQSFTNQAIIQFIGNLNHAAELTINDQPVTLENDLSFDYSVTLQDGLNQITVVARDAVDSEAVLTRNITLDTSVPGIPVSTLISVSSPDAGVVTISGELGSAEPFARVVVVNLRTGETLIVSSDAEGAFSVQINGNPGDTYSITVQDAAGNQSDAIQTSDGSSGNLPPDPSTVAPPLNPTESTSHLDATSFLYTGTNPIQTGVAPGTIEAKRSAVIRGKVLDKQNSPLSGVTVTIKDHSEFGQTISRADGMFDMAVNGGGQYVVNYQMQDYLPAQRRVKTGWRDYHWADDVVLIQLDPQVTTIDLTSTEPMQVAQGYSPMTDADGTRQATIMIPQGTIAGMTLPDGSNQPLM